MAATRVAPASRTRWPARRPSPMYSRAPGSSWNDRAVERRATAMISAQACGMKPTSARTENSDERQDRQRRNRIEDEGHRRRVDGLSHTLCNRQMWRRTTAPTKASASPIGARDQLLGQPRSTRQLRKRDGDSDPHSRFDSHTGCPSNERCPNRLGLQLRPSMPRWWSWLTRDPRGEVQSWETPARTVRRTSRLSQSTERTLPEADP